MGQVATLFRLPSETLETFEDEGRFVPDRCSDSLYVDKMWEPIMFVYGRGFIGREPLVNIFMPRRTSWFAEKEEKWQEPDLRYHSVADVVEMSTAMAFMDRATATKYADVEKINERAMYQVQLQYREELIDLIVSVKAFFLEAEERREIVIGAIG